jgi:hypothetical protein
MREIVAAGRFDLDHVGAHRAEQFGRPWPDSRNRQIEYPDAIENFRHRGFLRL